MKFSKVKLDILNDAWRTPPNLSDYSMIEYFQFFFQKLGIGVPESFMTYATREVAVGIVFDGNNDLERKHVYFYTDNSLSAIRIRGPHTVISCKEMMEYILEIIQKNSSHDI